MVLLVAAGVLIATLLGGSSAPTRVGFIGPVEVLAGPFTTSATALGADVTVSAIAGAVTGENRSRMALSRCW
jgi:hypothetical protein